MKLGRRVKAVVAAADSAGARAGVVADAAATVVAAADAAVRDGIAGKREGLRRLSEALHPRHDVDALTDAGRHRAEVFKRRQAGFHFLYALRLQPGIDLNLHPAYP